ncbi:MAG: hypothetical protein Q4C20_01040 [Erysipelotrichaceae bacterium]|nr:hypothetical protein [Erysipelotrichaceae bacterium]
MGQLNWISELSDLMIHKVFIRGFLLTEKQIEQNQYRWMGDWRNEQIGFCNLYVHPLQHFYTFSSDSRTFILIGHAYNPFTLEHDEQRILEMCSSCLSENEGKFFEYFNQLTGIFAFFIMTENDLKLIGDPTCMQTVFYTDHSKEIFVTSHSMMAGILLDLPEDEYVRKLVNYKFFHLLGNSLPGDLSQFNGLKRITPNICYQFANGSVRKERFFTPYQIKNRTMNQLAVDAGTILHNSLKLIPEKWSAPAISLTGGCDSKTTLACANNLYDMYTYFSYCSSEAEKVDCEGAAEICKRLGIQHSIIDIPESCSASDDYESVRRILKLNCGDILDSNPNDIRKRICLDKVKNYDVEVKSWASEIGRAYYSKRFNGRKDFPVKPNGRYCTTLYKFFLHNRKLVKETDQVFTQFIADFYAKADNNPLPWFEQFFWEFRVPSWNGLVISGEHSYTSDIEIPYNNRLLLTILVSAPIEDRINDTLYSMIRSKQNSKVDESGIAITNLKHTALRARAEDIYWVVHSHISI